MAGAGQRTLKTLPYRRCRFVTRLPTDYLYTTTHYWVARTGEARLRIGLTKFGTRLLGEMVEHQFSAEPAAPVSPGQVLGTLEGFKAISEIVCVAKGTFVGGNPGLERDLTLLNQDPYGAGWIYEVQGVPDPPCMRVRAYAAFLNQTIDRLRERADR